MKRSLAIKICISVTICLQFSLLEAAQFPVPATLKTGSINVHQFVIEHPENSQLTEDLKQLATKLIDAQEIAGEHFSLMRLHSLRGDYQAALQSLRKYQSEKEAAKPGTGILAAINYQLFLNAALSEASGTTNFEQAMSQVFSNTFQSLSDHEAYRASHYATYNLEQGASFVGGLLKSSSQQFELDSPSALRLLEQYQDFRVYQKILPLTEESLAKDRSRRYFIDDEILIETAEGAKISATVVRSKASDKPQPTALIVHIYTDSAILLREGINAASRGYVGVVADTRGKRLSPDTIEPYENEANDIFHVIDWITKQPWSDKRVAMYGGSYSGFAQWAATKKMHPALKTIVPERAAIPGQGLPMENNVFLNANYGWAFYVTNNKFLDDEVYFDNQRWRDLNSNWYQSGKAYRDIDKIDGTPNPWLQKWLLHPSYDEYWQRMVPYQHDYEQINIPVLSITGYYDDGQISAIHYLNEHNKYNTNAQHYLVIGPSDHQNSQLRSGVLRGYKVDEVGLFDPADLTFAWFDHVLKGAERPELVKQKVNYQLMGDNSWHHSDSLAELNSLRKRFYLTASESGTFHVLSELPEAESNFLLQEIDLSERSTSNGDYYPWPIIKETLSKSNGLVFLSKPIQTEMIVSGQMTGELFLRINKKDLDLTIVLYEILPDGRAFHLSYFIGRASYAKDMSKRQLLTPGAIETVPFERTRMTGRKLQIGSRLAIVIDGNKNSVSQINYGTGKDVSVETIEDAKIPLTIEFHNNSYVDIPVRNID
jgi:putative CocE/NonD family hydrolase